MALVHPSPIPISRVLATAIRRALIGGISHQRRWEHCWSSGAWVLERDEELDAVKDTPDCGYLYARAAKVRRDGRMQPVPLDTICITDKDA